MTQDMRQGSKRSKKGWIALGVVCAGIVLFHKPLFLIGCKTLLKARSVSYESIRWEENLIVLSGLQVKDPSTELTVDRVELKFDGDFLRGVFKPELKVIHPQILIFSSSQSSILPFLYRTRWIEPQWEVNNGVLQISSTSRFYFSLSPGTEEGAMGTLLLSCDPNPGVSPLLSAELIANEGVLQVGFKLNEGDISRLLPLASVLFADLPRNWEKASGEMELEGLFCLDGSFKMKELHANGVGKGIVLTGSKIAMQCEEIKGAFSYPVSNGEGFFWSAMSASLSLKEGGCQWDSFGMQALNGELMLDPEKEPHLQLGGTLLQEKREIPFVLSGKGGVQPDSLFWSEVTLTSKSSNGTDLQGLFSLCRHDTGEVALHVKVGDAQFDHLDFLRAFNGISGVCEEGVAAIEATFLYRGNQWQKAAVENCHLDKVRWLFPNEKRVVFAEQIVGDSAWIFSGKTWVLDELHMHMQQGNYVDPSMHLEGLSSNVVFEKKELEPSLFMMQGAVSVTVDSAVLPSLRLEGNVKWDGEHFKGEGLCAECEGLAVHGTMDWDRDQFLFSTSRIAGDVKGLLSLLSHFPALPQVKVPVQGKFSSGEKGFYLNNEGWGFEGSFDHLDFPINVATRITEGRCRMIFDSNSKKLVVEKGEGRWTLIDGTVFSVQVQEVATQPDRCDFALKVVDGKKEFALFEGEATLKQSQGWEIQFAQGSTHFGGTQLNISRCLVTEEMQLSSFEMQPVFKCQGLYGQAAFLQNAGFLPSTFSPKNLQEWELEGTLQTRVFSEDVAKGFALHAESSDLKVKGKPWSAFQLKAQKIGEKWLIEKLDAGSLQLKGAFIVDNDALVVPQFEGNWEGVLMKGSGSLKPEEKRFSCHFESVKGVLPSLHSSFAAGGSLMGDYSNPEDFLLLAGEANLSFDVQAPIPMSATVKKKVKFTYCRDEGLLCDGIDVHFKHKLSGTSLADLKAAKLQQRRWGDFSLQQLHLSLSPALLGHCIDAKWVPSSFRELEWEGSLAVDGDFSMAQGAPVFQGTLKPGRYGYAGTNFPIEQAHLRYEKEQLSARIKTQVEEQPLWSSVHIDLAKEPFGAIKLLDSPKAEGLRILFSTQEGLVSWESIQGSCYGINCLLAKSATNKVPMASVLSGEINVDGNSFALLLPKEIREGMQNFKLGTGYKWKGDLTVWQEAKRGFSLSGILEGRNFEAFGYQFHALSGNILASPEHVFITDLRIDDEAGLIGIKKIALNKENQWTLCIPQIRVADLQPSLMRKVDGTEQTIKPFRIKSLILSDIKGRLGDKSSLEGSGRLTFTNQFKKEVSLLDIPLEMIKKIGLDPGLLTPIQGELQMELCGDKLYLVSLENSFSDGERAEFYLSPEHDLSFIDLDGKITINLKMRQDVMLKITEAFTLTIRGTLEKPRYGLQY